MASRIWIPFLKTRSPFIKGTLSRDFLLQVSLHGSSSPQPLIFPEAKSRFVQKIREDFHSSMLLFTNSASWCQLIRWKLEKMFKEKILLRNSWQSFYIHRLMFFFVFFLLIFQRRCKQSDSVVTVKCQLSFWEDEKVIGTRVLRVFLLAIHSHLYQRILLPPPPPPEQKWFETVCNENFVYGNLKSENFQDYVQKPQRNCTRRLAHIAIVVELLRPT